MPPTKLIESLQVLRRKVKVFGVVYGAGVVAAAAVGLVLLAVLVDWVLRLPSGPRVGFNILVLGALGYAMYRWIVRPALGRLTLTDLAGRLENVFPQFDDRLRSTVNFLDAPGAVHGSEVMKERTISEANRLAQDVDLDHAVRLKPVWYSVAGGTGSIVAIIALALFVSHRFPDFFNAATSRLLGSNIAYPRSVQIELLDGGAPKRVAAGQDIAVRMRLSKGSARQAVIHYRYDDGPWQQEVMEKSSDGVYATTLAARLENNKAAARLQIRVEAGDDEQVLAPVAVVARLDIKGVVAQVTPPAYAGLPAAPVNISERPVVTAIGSEIALQVTFNKSLDTTKNVSILPVDKGRKAPAVAWTFPTSGQAVGTFSTAEGFKANDPFRFTIVATDTDGFENTGSQEYQIIAHDDSLPSVVIEEPRRSEERTPNATVPLKAVAEDDYGIRDAQLFVTGVSPSLAGKTWTLDLVKDAKPAGTNVGWVAADSTTDRKRFRLDYGWELEKLAAASLKPGDTIEFLVRVKDNYRVGASEHPWVESSKLRITIISQDQWNYAVEAMLGQARQEINAIKKGVDVNKNETEQQAKDTKEAGKLDDAQKATVGRLATAQSTAAAQTKQAAQKLADLVKRMEENKSPEGGAKKAAKDAGDLLDKTAESPLKDATNQLNEAKDTKPTPGSTPQQQKENQQQAAQKAADALKNAAQNQDQASKQLDQAMNKLNDFGGLAPQIQKLQELQKRQLELDKEYKERLKEALGKKADELSEKEKNDIKDLAAKQDQVQKETEKAIADMDSKGDKMQKSDPAAAQAMKQAAQTGQQQGVPQKQQQSSQSMQQNQQANAQNNQKQVELGLDMMLNQLKAAEQRKLAELQAELANLQKIVDELIVRQAGHNIDNLLLQDPAKITKMTEQAQKELFALAKRELAKLAEAKADLAVLTPSQEQTERNTRDVAQRSASLPEAGPSAKLTTAAGKMASAIVYLRKSQLAEAYDPPQSEALKALLETKAAVDEMKKKNDDQMQEQKEESIKQAYVKLLEAQKKLDGETTDIDKTPKDDDGNLPLLVSRRLGQLPTQQADLSKQAKDLGEKLQTLKSIVYDWANRDIVTSMDEVKDDLAKPKTDVVVQAEQKRIEEQLAAMIDNLAKKPPEDPKFADRKGGPSGPGGGGKPPPKMPTDVELRLLRDLQSAINKSTGTIDAEVKKAGGKKDAQKLLSLGGRQGEIRNLLDQLLQQASEGKVKLDAEPDNKDQLPEEASKEAVDQKELIEGLLNDNPQEDEVMKGVKITGDRMGRSRQRLALNNDPGKTTQEIQKRIVVDLDDLIKLAQQQQQQASGKPKPGSGKPGEQPGPPQPGEPGGQQTANGGKPSPQPGNPKGGTTPAGASSLAQGGDPQTDLSRPLLQKANAEWGKLSPRDRQAVQEGASEKSFQKYDQLIDDYYREVAKKASER